MNLLLDLTSSCCRRSALAAVLGFAAIGFSANGVAQVLPAPGATPAQSEAPIMLGVFQVGADQDKGYVAATAMTATRTNEKLENLPNSISIMTREFIEDLAFNNYLDAIDFAISAENVYNAQGTVGAPTGNTSGNQVNIRGLASVRQLRDGFPWYAVQDVYNTERLEISRGPGGLAYGDVDAGGIINIATKRATFQRKTSAQVRLDSFGTQRFSIDANQPLVPGRLGARFNAIHSEVRQWHERMGRDLEGYAGALRWEPFNNQHRTQIDTMYETGNSTYHLSHLAFNDKRTAYVPGTGTTALDANPNVAGVQANGVGMLRISPVGNQHALLDINGVIYNLQSTATNVFRVSNIAEGGAAISASDPQNPNRYAQLSVPENLMPREQDWGGPDGKQNTKYYAYTMELKHSFSPRLNALLAYNRQSDLTARKQSISAQGWLGIGGRSVHIDVNPVLPNPNGSGTIPNPNFEKPFIVYTPLLNIDNHEVQNWRGAMVYDAVLPWGISQRVMLGGTYRHERYDLGQFREALTSEEIARRGYTGAAATYPNNYVFPVHYLHDGNSDQTLGWNITPGITQLFRDTPAQNRRLDQSLTSASANMLGSYFKGKVRTSVGVSRDHWLQSANLALRTSPTTGEQQFVAASGALIPNHGTDAVAAPVYPLSDEWSTNQTYGAVWHPLRWLSLTAGYFESSQFSDNYGLDLNGNARAPLTGEGTDYSIRFHLWDGRVELSATRFETKQENINGAVSAVAQAELNPLLAVPMANNGDYRDRTSTGWEYQILTNLTPNWTLIGSVSRNSTTFTRFFPLLGAKLSEARANARARGLDPDTATAETRLFLEDQEGNVSSQKRTTANLTTRYTFRGGRFNGLGVGVASRFAKGLPRPALVVADLEVLPDATTDDYVIVNPFVTTSSTASIGRFSST
jgi:outer membrane receptor protein involved in Fe transport